jgi:hypothetical protein
MIFHHLISQENEPGGAGAACKKGCGSDHRGGRPNFRSWQGFAREAKLGSGMYIYGRCDAQTQDVSCLPTLHVADIEPRLVPHVLSHVEAPRVAGHAVTAPIAIQLARQVAPSAFAAPSPPPPNTPILIFSLPK